MPNKRIIQILYHALVGQLTDEERTQLDAWRRDARHEQFYQQLMADDGFDRLYRAHATADLDAAWCDFVARVMPKAQTLAAKTAPRHWTVVWRHIAVAAAVAAVAVVVWWRWPHAAVAPTPAPMSEAMTVAMQTAEAQAVTAADCVINGHRLAATSDSTLQAQLTALAADGASLDEVTGTLTTHHDKEFWTTLSDGTRVHLNYNTRLTYPLLFGDRREVTLDGEAYFVVAKDETGGSRPFIVHTAAGDVRAYGTEFNVNTRGTHGHTEVVLVRGSVGVATVGFETRLRPGQLATLTGNGPATVSQVDTGPYVSWNTGQFTFDNCPLDQLMTTVGSWHGCTVVFRNSDDRHIPFMGTIDKYAPLPEILQSVETITGLHVTQTNKQIIIHH